MKYKTTNLKETYELARRFAFGEFVGFNKERKSATVVGLFGDLGSGKTSFTQGVAEALGIKEHITSPTFVLEKIYKLSPPVSGKEFFYKHLVHIDAYRLDGANEMSALGWDEIIRNPKNIVFIEWPERVRGVLPKDMIKIYFKAGKKEEERIVKILC